MKNPLRVIAVLLCLALPMAQAANNPPPRGGVELLAESLPTIQTWVPPAFPAGVPADVSNGFATVRLVVDETGAITTARIVEATQPAFETPAIETVKRWTFTPGVEFGKRVPMSVDITLEFERRPPKYGLLPPTHMWPKLAPRTEAFVKSAPLGQYPLRLSGRGIPGIVLFRCKISPEGKPVDLKILGATHADFIPPGLEAFHQWEFQPAKSGDVSVEAEIGGEITFAEMDVPPELVAASNGLTAADESHGGRIPRPRVVVDAVLPYDFLLEGRGGSATVGFLVDERGYVKNVRVHEATPPEFGDAVALAMEAWRFDPVMQDGRGVEARLWRKVEFRAMDEAADEKDPVVRLVRAARAGTIRSASGLDGKLVPIHRPPPVLSNSDGQATKPTGEVRIEFVIDRDGRARLPRVISAAQPALGLAAATAVSQWMFQPPTRGGEPTEVRVLVPMKF